jgi:hypothetical protein
MIMAKERPTLRQAKAMELLLLNGGNVSKAMLQAGYSVSSARVPQRLLHAQAVKKSFNELYKRHDLNMDILMGIVSNLVHAIKYIGDDADGEPVFIPDMEQRVKGYDRAIKLLMATQSDDDKNKTPTPVMNSEQLKAAIDNKDVAELQRIIFNKD